MFTVFSDGSGDQKTNNVTIVESVLAPLFHPFCSYTIKSLKKAEMTLIMALIIYLLKLNCFQK